MSLPSDEGVLSLSSSDDGSDDEATSMFYTPRGEYHSPWVSVSGESKQPEVGTENSLGEKGLSRHPSVIKLQQIL